MNLEVVSKEEAIQAIKDACKKVMDGCETYYDEEVNDRVYVNPGEVTGILKMNKEAIVAVNGLPSAQPEIIRCKDCKWYGRADKGRFYRGMDCLQNRIGTIVPDKDFCSRAERRSDECD